MRGSQHLIKKFVERQAIEIIIVHLQIQDGRTKRLRNGAVLDLIWLGLDLFWIGIEFIWDRFSTHVSEQRTRVACVKHVLCSNCILHELDAIVNVTPRRGGAVNSLAYVPWVFPILTAPCSMSRRPCWSTPSLGISCFFSVPN